jgi:hypothetical protein
VALSLETERKRPASASWACVTENRDGVVADACLTEANGHPQRIEGPNDRGTGLRDDRKRCRTTEIEVSPIPGVSPDGPPAPIRRQFAGALMRPPEASATAPVL